MWLNEGFATFMEQIFRENYAPVFRAAYRVTGNANDAEDVLQTVFLRMLKRDPGAKPVENMSSFLRRSAVNAALDLVRSRKHIRNVPLDDWEPVLAESPHRRPDRAQTSSEIREWLRGALARTFAHLALGKLAEFLRHSFLSIALSPRRTLGTRKKGPQRAPLF